MADLILNPLLIDRLKAIPWFQSCGKEPPPPDTLLVKSAGEARKNISSRRWENTILDFREDFTEALCILSIRTKGGEDRCWNPLTMEFREKHLPSLEPLWQKALEPLGLWDKPVLDDLRFNLMAIAAIDAYQGVLDTPEFFRRLLELYQDGRLPCGWKGKKSKGCFLVY